MSFSINTNLGALNAHRNLSKIDDQRNNTLERLSTGLRINKAADDASGLSIADGFHAQSLGIGQAISNGTDATALVQIADGALQESTNILNTIRTKSVQAASDGQTPETRRLIQNDIDRLKTQFDNIAQTTSFNGQKLLSGAFSNKSFQIGANANQTVNVSIGSAESTRVGHVSTADLELTSAKGGDVQLSLTSGVTGDKVTLNTVSIQANNQAENGLGALASEINRYSATTGIQATADVQTTGSSAIAAGTTGSDFAINGVTIGAITVQNNDSNSALVNGINEKSAETGTTASTTQDGKLVLTSNDGRAISVTGTLGGVAGATTTQLSTFGSIHLVQSGVSDFQLSGITASATGANFTISAPVTTADDSELAAGSTIAANSTLAKGSTLGGTLTVKTTVTTSVDSLVKAGSSLKAASILKAGTTVGADITVDGTGNKLLTQDSLVAKGSTFGVGSILGAGTVVQTAGTYAGVARSVGDVLQTNTTLAAGDTFLTDADWIVKNSGGTAEFADGTVLKAGSVLGGDFTLKAATAATTTDMQLKSGSTVALLSTLTSGSTLGVNTDANAVVVTTDTTKLVRGSTLTTNSVLAQGSTIGGLITTASDTVLLADQTVKAGSTLKADSILAAGTKVGEDLTLYTQAGGAGDKVTVKAGESLSQKLYTSTDTLLKADLMLKQDSVLETGSQLAQNTTAAGTFDLDNKKTSRLADINVLTSEGAQAAISIADAALKDVNRTRASLGAVQNQLSSTLANLSVTQTNVNAAESSIRDVDFASEAGNFSRLQVLSQAGSFALSQANAASQSVLSLLQR